MVLPPLLLGAGWETWIYRGLATAHRLSLRAGDLYARRHCPAGASRQGGAALKILGGVTTVAFDKTGTLTRGEPRVTDAIALEGSEEDLLATAAAMEQGASHSLGCAIVAEARGLALPGKGVKARLHEGFALVASLRHAAELAPLPEAAAERLRALEPRAKLRCWSFSASVCST